MSKRPARFTEADVRRVIRAVSKERAEMEVRIDPDGSIRIVPYHPPATNDATRPVVARESRIHL
ncbi:hypothetical protein LMG27198_24020 [Methylocystis echinoides]|uniref:Uncharacterized protein n=1 Tax=Methylocystis echinoides TaxID=29468 RepID=A0A9W6LS85_9HYPH|nr:hypothetical protein LMG27198_24020 [Methylocystis echinoides]